MEVEPRPLGADEQLLFLHIPKTAGTSLIRLLDQHFVEDELCPVDWPERYLLREIKAEEIKRARFVRGHFEFNYVIKMFERSPRVLTMLRDPVERFVSEFEHLRRIVTGEERPAGINLSNSVLERDKILRARYPEIADGRMGLEEFLERPDLTKWLVGTYVRILGWWRKREVALRRVRTTFEFVGITEEFERSIELLSYLLGLPAPQQIWRLNRAPQQRKRGERWDLSADLRKRIEELVTQDMEIYVAARERFERDYAAMQKMKRQRRFYLTRWLWPGGPERRDDEISEIYFDFRRVPIGYGWQVGKRHPKAGIVRFLCQGTMGQLFFSLPSRPWRLQIGVWFPRGKSDGSLRAIFNHQSLSLPFISEGQAGYFIAEAALSAKLIHPNTWNHLTLQWQPKPVSGPRAWLARGVYLLRRYFTWPFLQRIFSRLLLPIEEEKNNIAFRWVRFLPIVENESEE